VVDKLDTPSPEQERTIQYLNDTWGISEWETDPSDGEVTVTLDDGDVVTIERGGEWWLQ
jgi:hypothetical protein